MGVCAGLLSASLFADRVQAQPFSRYEPVRLTDADGAPLAPDSLQPQREYLFFYPYPCTPCFLLDLGRPCGDATLRTAAGREYRWPGGIGPNRSVVAFAAICAHKLSYPAKPVSFIGFRPQPVGFLNGANSIERRAAVIQCCSEHSIYDPAAGAKVLSGPAPQPLAAINLTLRGGRLVADGVFGGTVYHRFFERFGYKLALEYGDRARQPVTGETVVVASEDYSRQQIQC